jgi:hypothetical protein
VAGIRKAYDFEAHYVHFMYKYSRCDLGVESTVGSQRLVQLRIAPETRHSQLLRYHRRKRLKQPPRCLLQQPKASALMQLGALSRVRR